MHMHMHMHMHMRMHTHMRMHMHIHSDPMPPIRLQVLCGLPAQRAKSTAYVT